MDCKAWTIWNFPPFNWIDPQNKRSLIEFSGKLSSCFQVSVNTRYFNYMMISIERVCKQPERRWRLHTREAPCTALAFTFSFQDELHFPKAHQQGQGPCSCYLDFRGWLLLVPAFPSSACLLSRTHSPGFQQSLPYSANNFFIQNPGFLLQDLKITWKHWPRCAGSGSFAEVRLRSSCPLLSVLLHFQATDTCLPILAASLQMGSGKCWGIGVHVRNVLLFVDRSRF